MLVTNQFNQYNLNRDYFKNHCTIGLIFYYLHSRNNSKSNVVIVVNKF